MQCVNQKQRVLVNGFLHDQRGTIAVLFALSSAILIVVAAAAVHVGQAMTMHARLQHVVDSVALAGARSLKQSGDPSKARDQMLNLAVVQLSSDGTSRSLITVGDGTQVRKESRPGYIDVAVSVSPGDATATATAGAAVAAGLLNLIGIDAIPVTVVAKAGPRIGYTPSATSQEKTLDVALMVDWSGSMNDSDRTFAATTAPGECAAKSDGTKFGALQVAACDFLNRILPDGDDEKVRMSIVPFSTHVKLDKTIISRMTGEPLRHGRQDLMDCVTDRVDQARLTDQPPRRKFILADSIDQFVGDRYKSGEMLSYCRTPAQAILPLTSSKSKLATKIMNLKRGDPRDFANRGESKEVQVRGGTAGHLGTAWAWYTIAPHFADIWGIKPREYTAAESTSLKAVILMTDGDYTVHHDGLCIGRAPCERSRADARQLCSNMRSAEKNVMVFAIGFGLSEATDYEKLPETDSRKVLYDCVGGRQHKNRLFIAYDGAALQDALNAIGTTLHNVRTGEGAPIFDDIALVE
ncbi:MAG: TadE/TadG family type IV pilus assembly protein [Pseudomonadota bacterium]